MTGFIHVYGLFPPIPRVEWNSHSGLLMSCLRAVREGNFRMKKQDDFTISAANSRCAIQTCQTNRLICAFVISMAIKLLFVCFDLLLSDHGNQLRSCINGQLSLPYISWSDFTSTVYHRRKARNISAHPVTGN